MVLVGARSNPKLGSVLQSLARVKRGETPRARPAATGSSDGRRRFGSVRDAILRVLAASEADLSVRDIHAGVERIFGSPVSRSSVKSYLHKGRGNSGVFERVSRGRYRIAAKTTGSPPGARALQKANPHPGLRRVPLAGFMPRSSSLGHPSRPSACPTAADSRSPHRLLLYSGMPARWARRSRALSRWPAPGAA